MILSKRFLHGHHACGRHRRRQTARQVLQAEHVPGGGSPTPSGADSCRLSCASGSEGGIVDCRAEPWLWLRCRTPPPLPPLPPLLPTPPLLPSCRPAVAADPLPPTFLPPDFPLDSALLAVQPTERAFGGTLRVRRGSTGGGIATVAGSGRDSVTSPPLPGLATAAASAAFELSHRLACCRPGRAGCDCRCIAAEASEGNGGML